MAEIASAYLSILPSFKGGSSAISRQVGPSVTKAGSSAGIGFGKAFLRAFIAIGVVTQVARFVGDALGEAREAQKVGALTENVLKTTGGAAKVTAAQVERLADALSKKTGIDDEQIQSAENLILTFKNVKREGEGLENVFGRAARAAVDLSASGFGDTSGTAKMLGKALNDPVKGLTALGRAGVTFTASQQDAIKAMVESGNLLGAQKAILKEVESQVKGSAEAQVTNADKARVAYANLKEQIGTALLPAVDSLAGVFAGKVIPAISSFITNLQTGQGRAGAFGNFLRGQVLPALRQFGTYLESKVIPAVRDALVPVLASASRTFNKVRDAVRENRPQLIQLWNAFKRLADFMLTKVLPVQIKMATVTLPVLGAAIRVIISTVAFWVSAFNAARAAVNAVRKGVSTAGEVIARTAKRIIDAFRKLPSQMVALGRAIVQGLINGIKSMAGAAAQAALDVVKGAFNAAKNFLKSHSPSKLYEGLGKDTFQGYINGMLAKSDATAKAAGDTVDKAGKKVKERIKKLHDQLKTATSDFASLVEPISSNFTQGLFDFDTAGAFTANLTTVKGTLTTLLGNFKKLIGEGLNPGFLYQLFQSGGPGLINSLAGLSKADALGANALFSDVMSLSDQLGTAVAGSTDKGAALENQTVRLERKLDKLINHVDHAADRTGDVVNGAAGAGHRRGKHHGGRRAA